jgi:hypothetical protein
MGEHEVDPQNLIVHRQIKIYGFALSGIIISFLIGSFLITNYV